MHAEKMAKQHRNSKLSITETFVLYTARFKDRYLREQTFEYAWRDSSFLGSDKERILWRSSFSP